MTGVHSAGKEGLVIEVAERECAGSAPIVVAGVGMVTETDDVPIQEMENTATGTGVLVAAPAGV